MNTQLAEMVWDSRYRLVRDNVALENNIDDTWARVARAVAGVETDPARWELAYRSILKDYQFLPAGRVLAGAGSDKQVTLFNCFVSGPLLDSIASILDTLKETAVTMQYGGGVGCDFSGLRPLGTPATRSGTVASGPLSFMHIWDSLCETLLTTSARRGAMMGTLRCDHPDIAAFIDAKRKPDALRNFNLSVLITDPFMRAVAADAEWALVYPAETSAPPRGGGTSRIVRSLPARELWRHITRSAHETSEPGLLFVDTINRNNNLYYREAISATNPCGEVPLPPYGACNLGSLNLPAFVREPFSARSRVDQDRLRETTTVAVRFLDDVISLSRFPLPQQASQAHDTRRTGLGITGLADALAMLGMHYDSDAAREFAATLMRNIRDAAYETSIALAVEKGPFPGFDADSYLAAPFIQNLPAALRDGIARNGLRNSHLLAIAPAGTISLLAGNVSSGIEPIYALAGERAIRGGDLSVQTLPVLDFAYNLWQQSTANARTPPDDFVTAERLPAKAHLAMQACLQPFVDNAISKTVNLPSTATIAEVERVFSTAYTAGLKGCTVFRAGSRQGQVLRACDESLSCTPGGDHDL